MFQPFLLALSVIAAAASVAADTMPLDQVQRPNVYLEDVQDRQLVIGYQGLTQSFWDEMVLRDVADIITDDLPDASVTLQSADLIVFLVEDWADAEGVVRSFGVFDAFADRLKDFIGTDATSHITSITFGENLAAQDETIEPITLHFFIVVKNVNGQAIPAACQARNVIDVIYHGGVQAAIESQFSVMACAESLR